MQTFQYVDPTTGQLTTKEAANETEALRGTGASGVRPVQGTQIQVPQNQGYTAPVPTASALTTDRLAAFQPAQDTSGFNDATNYYKEQSNTLVPTETDAYNQQLQLRQAEIDAANATYNTLLNQTRRQNLERSGSAGARQARAGLLGSERGAAIDTNTDVFNQEQIQSVEGQRRAAIAEIMGKAREGAAKEVADKRAAKEAGYSKYIEFVGATETRNKAKLSGLATQLMAAGIDVNTMSPSELESIAKSYGVDKADIVSAYKAVKQAEETNKLAIEKTRADIDKTKSDIENAGFFELSEGQARYDKNGKLIASKGKTYAPSSGGGLGMGGSGAGGQYGTDLDAIIGATLSTIPSKFGQSTFQTQISRARNDGDKISLVAAQVLKGAPSADREDFKNQSVGIKNIDKAIAVIDSKAKTGVINNAKQYTYNVFGRDYDPQLAEINAYITAAVQPYRNSVTGAAWGTQEDDEYASLFGSTKYSPAELKDRLVRVKEILKDKSVTALNSYINPLNTYENPFVQPGQQPVTQTNTSGAVDLSEFGL